MIRPIILHASLIWGIVSKTQINRLKTFHHKTLRILVDFLCQKYPDTNKELEL